MSQLTSDDSFDDNLLQAILMGDMKKVDEILADGVTKLCSQGGMLTPLHYACVGGHLPVIEALVNHCPSCVECTDYVGQTPLHYACWWGNLEVCRKLISFGAKLNAKDINNESPLHLALRNSNCELVLNLLEQFDCDASMKGYGGDSLLHLACKAGGIMLVRTLILTYNVAINAVNDDQQTPLHLVVLNSHHLLASILIEDFGCDISGTDKDGKSFLSIASSSGNCCALFSACCPKTRESLLHLACKEGLVDIVRILVSEYDVDVNIVDNEQQTPLYVAALNKHYHVAKVLVDELGCARKSPLHLACKRGEINVIRALVSRCNVDVNTDVDEHQRTLLHIAAQYNHYNIGAELIEEFGCNINAVDSQNKSFLSFLRSNVLFSKFSPKTRESLLHLACKEGLVDMVQTLVSGYNVDVNAVDKEQRTPLHVAALYKQYYVAALLIDDFDCNISAMDKDGKSFLSVDSSSENISIILDNSTQETRETLLYLACKEGQVDVIRTLVANSSADVSAYDKRHTPLLCVAALYKQYDVAVLLIEDYGCDISSTDENNKSFLQFLCPTESGRFFGKCHPGTRESLLYLACREGNVNIVHHLIAEYHIDVNSSSLGKTPLHYSCVWGQLEVSRTLLRHGADSNAQDESKNTPLHYARNVQALALLDEFDFDVGIGNSDGDTLLHGACGHGEVDMIRTLVLKHKADVNVKNNKQQTALHIAALCNDHKMALVLIELGCDVEAKDNDDRSFLHLACGAGSCSIINAIGDQLLQLASVIDDNGDTPLHTCSANGYGECAKALLQFNVPVLVRNNAGKTPIDIATGEAKVVLDQYMRDNRKKIYLHYDKIQKQAVKKSSKAKRITRVFVIGNPGAGKSSLVETLKREKFYQILKVSERSVPPHTAGIIPSEYKSKHYGRTLFYDFAGDPEYYSSHAAILENLTSSKKGDYIFLIVVDLREKNAKILNILHYWSAFIHHQKFYRKPYLIVVGSHIDSITEEVCAKKKDVIAEFCVAIQAEFIDEVDYFTVNCCQPNSKYIGQIQDKIVSISKDSPRYKITPQASLLLWLLSKDFSNVITCSIEDILSHIEDTGISLPKAAQLLHPVLRELHDICFLLLLKDRSKERFRVVLNPSKLTNKVHKSLFSKEAEKKFKEFTESGPKSCFNIGIISENALREIFNLHKSITVEFLVQLQYCQEIQHQVIGIFTSLAQPTSSYDKTFLFFPALCIAEKSDDLLSSPEDFDYSIGWLARCINPHNFFPPRFLHVLLLRLVNHFALPVPTYDQESLNIAPVIQRRCTMWKSGVHWIMEEDVECMVELIDSKEVMVITRSKKTLAENCIAVFDRIISYVMDAKAEFCDSVKPELFLLDPSEDIGPNENNMFAMRDVERILASEHLQAVVSVNGKKRIERTKLLILSQLTHWRRLFPINFNSVHSHLKDVVQEVSRLGLNLGLPLSTIQAIEKNFPNDIVKCRIEIINEWMNSTVDSPCWWHLVKALREVERGDVAGNIEKTYRVEVELQKALLCPEKQGEKPDKKFLEQFAGVVASKWPSLISVLSLTSTETEDTSEEEEEEMLSEQDHTLFMLRRWVQREDATYGQLCQKLMTVSLFHYATQ